MSKVIGSVETEDSLVDVWSDGREVRVIMNHEILSVHKKSDVDTVTVGFIDFLYSKTKELECIDNLIRILEDQRAKAVQDIYKRLENEYGTDPTPEYRCPAVF